jgi:hypothetical protein
MPCWTTFPAHSDAAVDIRTALVIVILLEQQSGQPTAGTESRATVGR